MASDEPARQPERAIAPARGRRAAPKGSHEGARNLLDLIRLRNRHPAFGGTFELQASDDDRLSMRWCESRTWIALTVSLAQRTMLIEGDDGSGPRRC